MTDPSQDGAYARSGPFRIHYQASGEGPPLLLLTGWSGSGLVWPPGWVAELDRSFRVLRVSYRGTGWSDPVAEPFTLSDLAADALATLDEEGVDRACVLGMSMGGMVAQTLVAEHPERVRALVLMATAPPRPEMVATEPTALIEATRPVPGRSREEMLAAIWPSLTAPDFPERHPDRVRELVAQVGIRPTRASVIALQFQAILGFTGAERLADVRVPTLVVHGDADPLLVVENGRRLARLVPHARYVELPGVGHLVPWEAPDESLAAIREALLVG